MEKEESVQHFLDLIKQSRRGKFKVYIGMIAGVGKTFRMLQAVSYTHLLILWGDLPFRLPIFGGEDKEITVISIMGIRIQTIILKQVYLMLYLVKSFL